VLGLRLRAADFELLQLPDKLELVALRVDHFGDVDVVQTLYHWFFEDGLDTFIYFYDLSEKVDQKIDIFDAFTICVIFSPFVFEIEKCTSKFVDLRVGILIEFWVEIGNVLAEENCQTFSDGSVALAYELADIWDVGDDFSYTVEEVNEHPYFGVVHGLDEVLLETVVEVEAGDQFLEVVQVRTADVLQ
jgi:hypothetical protein